MKRTIIILTMGLILFLSCQNNNTVSYYQTALDEFYRDVEFNAFNELTLQDRIDNETRKHLFYYYGVKRDSLKQPTHIEYVKKQKPSAGGFDYLSSNVSIIEISYMEEKDIFVCMGYDKSRVIETFTFIKNKQGQYMRRVYNDMQNDKKKYMSYTYKNNMLRKAMNTDSSGSPAINKEGIAGYLYEYDEKGNLMSERYLDIEGNITVKSNGIGGYNYYYNDKNQRVKTEIIGSKFNIIRTAEAEYNDNGMVKRAVFFDGAGNPLSGTGNVPVIEYEYDRYGNMTALIHKDMQGELVEDRQGIAKTIYKYKNGKIIMNEYDKEGSQAIGFEVK